MGHSLCGLRVLCGNLLGAMCGRYSLVKQHGEIEGAFDVSLDPSWVFPRFNIAPTQDVLAITNDGERRAEMLRWGLIPWFVKDPKKAYKPINARAEEVVEKSYFREAFDRRRCLVIADGFYEWKKPGKPGTPYRIGLRTWEPFAFAGLRESRRSTQTGEVVRSCTIVTTAANRLIEPIHDRMPVMLSEDAGNIWLDMATSSAELRELLVPYDASEMEAYEVSSVVNSWQNDDPTAIQPVARLQM